MSCQYAFKIRCAHWLLARISLLQSICLLLWLGERAYHEIEPPIHPWIVYIYIGIGLIASTGIASRFLTRLSLTIILFSQIYIAYLFGVEKRLGYSRCLRARIGLRCLTTVGIYFRLLGVNNYVNHDKSITNKQTHKPYSNFYAFGLAIMSVSVSLLGIFCIPLELFQLDKDIQLTEIHSTWILPVNSYCCSLFSFFLGICMLMAGFIYSIPVIIHNKLMNNTDSFFSYNNYIFRFSDYLVAFSFLMFSLSRDCNFNYWHIKGCEFWLEIRVLLENITVLLGIPVINHLLTINMNGKYSKSMKENFRSSKTETTNSKNDYLTG
ncbi:unnamed protein product [Heterobilharzia americana]|nr:unnamed protein product [Heterobilharzia americana]